ncbi:thiolase-like protein [Pavlovales sp. CCMP2436]|nr:thiolase-like protein [Pavlovales sp. CCMP2436]
MQDIVDAAAALAGRGYRRISPFFVPRALVNMAAGQIALRHGLRGPCHSAATACATGAHSVGDAFRMIAYGDADLMVAGASEAAITPLAIAGFCRLSALSTGCNENPERASRPFDRNRDGFVMGEGSAALVLESLDHALARGAGGLRGGGGDGEGDVDAGRVYAELVGYGQSCDAHHITSPPADGDGALRCMRAALADARLAPAALDYISAHATSTSIGDEIELRAIVELMRTSAEPEQTSGRRVTVSSTKGATGHLLGAAGALEAAFAALAAHRRIAPPGVNLDMPAEVEGALDALDLNVEPRDLGGGAAGAAEQRAVVTMSNSFGFGGTNASLVFRSFHE